MSSSLVDPNEICPASGLTNASCMATICDCFPDEPDRFSLHPERFIVGRVEGELEETDGSARP